MPTYVYIYIHPSISPRSPKSRRPPPRLQRSEARTPQNRKSAGDISGLSLSLYIYTYVYIYMHIYRTYTHINVDR